MRLGTRLWDQIPQLSNIFFLILGFDLGAAYDAKVGLELIKLTVTEGVWWMSSFDVLIIMKISNTKKQQSVLSRSNALDSWHIHQ